MTMQKGTVELLTASGLGKYLAGPWFILVGLAFILGRGPFWLGGIGGPSGIGIPVWSARIAGALCVAFGVFILVFR